MHVFVSCVAVKSTVPLKLPTTLKQQTRKILYLSVIMRKMEKKSDLTEVVVFSDWMKSNTKFMYLDI